MPLAGGRFFVSCIRRPSLGTLGGGVPAFSFCFVPFSRLLVCPPSSSGLVPLGGCAGGGWSLVRPIWLVCVCRPCASLPFPRGSLLCLFWRARLLEFVGFPSSSCSAYRHIYKENPLWSESRSCLLDVHGSGMSSCHSFSLMSMGVACLYVMAFM